MKKVKITIERDGELIREVRGDSLFFCVLREHDEDRIAAESGVCGTFDPDEFWEALAKSIVAGIDRMGEDVGNVKVTELLANFSMTVEEEIMEDLKRIADRMSESESLEVDRRIEAIDKLFRERSEREEREANIVFDKINMDEEGGITS